jgi:hypothetical protein
VGPTLSLFFSIRQRAVALSANPAPPCTSSREPFFHSAVGCSTKTVLFRTIEVLLADLARLTYRLSRGRIRYPRGRVFIPHDRCCFTEATLLGLVKPSGLRVAVLEKMGYPLEKIRTNAVERAILRCIYAAAGVLKCQTPVMIREEKP